MGQSYKAATVAFYLNINSLLHVDDDILPLFKFEKKKYDLIISLQFNPLPHNPFTFNPFPNDKF